MWAAVSASVVGTSHTANGLPCQDACGVVRWQVGEKDLLVAAVADGAGSATHSHIGSSEAVQHILSLITQSEVEPTRISQENMLGWYQGVLTHLQVVAEREGVSTSELACTLLVGIVWREGAIFGQIGDGAWVVDRAGELVAGTWPETGEFANVTVFLTTKGALGANEDGSMVHLQFKRHEGPVSGIAGFTDGIQMLTLDYAQKAPFSRFFNAMFGTVRTSYDETELIAPLRQMLNSEVINSRTDDDKTLVLAVWREPEAKTGPKDDADRVAE